MASWPVLDGDPRWEEKLGDQMTRLRTRLQKKLSSAKGEKKASLAAQLKALREDFQKERARLAESEKSGGYVVAKATRNGRPKPALDSAAEAIGEALGRVAARLEAWTKDRASLAADIQVLATSTQELLTKMGHNAGDAIRRTRTAERQKGAKRAAATTGRTNSPRKKRKPAPAPPEDGGFESTEIFDQTGGDHSDRAAHSGATGERSASGGRNKREPRDQDEKGMGHPRNR